MTFKVPPEGTQGNRVALFLDEAGGDQPIERFSLVQADIGIMLDRKRQVGIDDPLAFGAQRQCSLSRLVAQHMHHWPPFHDALVGRADRWRAHPLRDVEAVEGDDEWAVEHV